MRSKHFATLMCELDGITFEQARNEIARWKLGGIIWAPPKLELKDKPVDNSWLPPEFEPVSSVWPKYLTRRGVKKHVAIEMGLGVCRSGVFAHRIILPIICPLGSDFQARSITYLDGEMERDMLAPRYLSGPTSGQLLFGWSTIEESDTAVLVEGPFDAMALMQCGFPSAAMMGKVLRDGQAQMLSNRCRDYVIMLDPISKDREAIRSACAIAEQLGGLVANNLEADSDPGDMIKPQHAGAAVIKRWIEEAIPPSEAMSRALAIWLKMDREARA